jgi:hypothetical protein
MEIKHITNKLNTRDYLISKLRQTGITKQRQQSVNIKPQLQKKSDDCGEAYNQQGLKEHKKEKKSQ